MSLKISVIVLMWLASWRGQAASAIPPKDIQIYVLMGQSNISGAGHLSELPQVYPRHPDKIWVFSNAWKWELAQEPIDSSIGQIDPVSADPGAGVGPGVSFADSLLEKNPDTSIALIPCAKGSTKISDWAQSTERSTLYGSCLHRIRAIAPFGKIQGILWYQGESDAASLEATNLWPQKFTALVEAWRKDLQNKRLPVVFAQLGPLSKAQRQRPDQHWANWDLMKIRQAEVKIEGVKMLTTDHLTLNEDGVHLNTTSQIALGKLFADRFLDVPR